jgi:hypothetical protein
MILAPFTAWGATKRVPNTLNSVNTPGKHEPQSEGGGVLYADVAVCVDKNQKGDRKCFAEVLCCFRSDARQCPDRVYRGAWPLLYMQVVHRDLR